MPKAQRQLRLNQTQRWALYKWIDANHQDFHGKADSEIAEMAFHALGFPVADTTINDIRTDPGIEATWRTSRDKAPESPTIEISADDILTIVQAIDIIAQKVDFMLPIEFIDLMNRAGSGTR